MTPSSRASASPQAPAPQDPKPAGPGPEFSQERIDPPGLERELTPKADHGEESYRGLGRLDGRAALITGGDSGIGRAVAIAFAREGADVAIAYLPDAQETRRWIEQAGKKALLLPGDICDEQHCRRIVERTIEELGTVDILVNNAAFQRSYDALADVTTDDVERTFATNVYAMVWLCRAALPSMAPGSAIINTSSIQAYDPNPSLMPYAMTKAAIVSFTKSLGKMAMQQGVRVNAVAPGPVWTPLIPSTLSEDHVKQFGANTSFHRPAQPVELAPLFVFLASNEARYVSGEVYGATGGRSPF
jgi:NAD(P)-dependent dehydrogenase (short-subunit alcohol dehydrogenase family)